jgi:hypothetical protein
LLPWNTTKTGIDQDSSVWRRVRTDVLQAGNEVVEMLNKLKTERQATTLETSRPLSDALEKAAPTPLQNIRPSPRLSYPAPPAGPRRDVKQIRYSVDSRRFDFVAGALGTSTVADVGRQTFDYFYKQQVDEDE